MSWNPTIIVLKLNYNFLNPPCSIWGNTQNSHRKKSINETWKQTFYCLKYFVPDRNGLQSMRISHVDQRASSVGHRWRWLPKLLGARSEIEEKVGREGQMSAFNRFLQEIYPKVEWGHSLCWVTLRSWLPIPQGAAGPHCSLTGMGSRDQVFNDYYFLNWPSAVMGPSSSVQAFTGSEGQQVRRRQAVAWTTLYTSRSEEHETKLKESFGLGFLYLLLLSRLETV